MTDHTLPSPPDDDGALFPEPATPDGRHATAFRRAFTAAESTNLLGEVDAALMSVALAGAAALDRAEAMPPGKSVYPVAQLLGPTREVLESLQLSPAVRGSQIDDELKAALDELATATDADPAIPHAEDAGHSDIRPGDR